MKKLNRTVALLCALALLFSAPAALAAEPSPTASQNEPSIGMDVWGFIQALFDNLVEVLPGQDEDPSAKPADDDSESSEEDGEGGGQVPDSEAFPWPDPNG